MGPIFAWIGAFALLPVIGLLDRERRIARDWRTHRGTLDLEKTGPLIERCYRLLVDAYGADSFAAPWLAETPVPTAQGVEVYQELAEVAADRWQVTLPPLRFHLLQGSGMVVGTYGRGQACAVNYGPEQIPLRVDLEWTKTHEIGLARSLLSDREALPVVIAHEISHLVLRRDRVTTGDQSDDEILTDVATALIGYGHLMYRLRSRTRRFAVRKGGLGWQVSGPGYLHAEELAFLQELHHRGAGASAEVA